MHQNHEHTHEYGSSSTFEAMLKEKRDIADGTMAFFFQKPDHFDFKAGQHTTLKLIDPPETDAEGNSRHLSFVNSPQENDIEVATRIRDTAFKRVLSHMPVGSTVIMENPHGSYTLQSDASKPSVFLIGGIGITPVMSIIKDATERKLPHHIFLFYSNKRPEDAPFFVELQELAKQNPSFKFIATMTEPEKSEQKWTGEIGYIDTSMLKRYLSDLQSLVYYLSGPPAMVAAMRKVLSAAGVSEDNIKTEEFSGY